MKRNNMILGILLSMAAGPVCAQGIWTMDQCMKYAVDHCTEMKKQQIEIQRSHDQYRAATASFFPTLQAAVDGQYNWGRNINPESNTYGNVTTFNNYYELYATLNVFNGFATLNAFKQARLSKSSSQTTLQKIRDDKAIEVMQKYVDAAYAQACITLAEEKLKDSRQLLTKTQRLMELGEKSRPDIAQIEAQVAEDHYNLTHQKNVCQQAMIALQSSMNFPVKDTIQINVSVTDSKPQIESDNANAIYDSFRKWSPEVLAAEFNVKNSQYNYQIQKAKMLPSIILRGGIATNYYRNLSQKGEYEPFHSQFHNNQGEYVVLTVSFPLFMPSQWRKIREARSDWQETQISLNETCRKLHDNIALAVADRDGYLKELLQMRRKVASDSVACYLSLRKYDEGMLSTFDLHSSTQTLLESRIKLLQMQMMYILKKKLVDYYKGQPLIADNKLKTKK